MSSTQTALRPFRIARPFLSALPAEVAAAVADLASDYGIKSARVVSRAAGYRHYLAEGERVTVVYGGQALDVEMASEANVGAAGLRHEIGHEQAMPAGTWIVSVNYYAGYYMTVYNVGLPALAA